ncbi:unnamed protein product [Pedinophyceae sp. YPF-701]|nr:unnamed protein product [Pedinophyceae sp. YPF-701]
MGAKLPTAGGDKDSAALDDALGELLGLEDVPDIIAVGSQESGALPAWEQMVLERLGDGYHLVGRQTLGALGLMVFTSAELHGRVGTVAADSVLAGAKQTVNFTATKGGVGISVALRGGPRLLFVNSHLTAQVRNVQQRNDDYHTIKRGLLRRALSNFKTATEAAGGSAGHHWHRPRDATKGHDLTIWLGDLNYRIMANRDAADRALSLGLPEVLLGNDQLRREQRHRRAFVHFQEGGIEFPPTYKYDPGTDKYDTSKKARVPSWTDRILFKTEHRLRGHEPVVKRYTCVSALKSSDHRPVVATLEVGLAPWEHARHDGAGGERGRSGAGWQTRRVLWCMWPVRVHRRRVSQMPMASRKIRGRIAPEVIPPSLDTASTAVVVEQSPEAERSS